MQSVSASHIQLLDLEPQLANFREEVLYGLTQSQKTLPCKFFYDERGSQLFDQICDLEEYYLTRADISIMCEHGAAIAKILGPQCMLVEYGSGSSTKTRILLDCLETPVAYVPIDIAREHLIHAATDLSFTYPELEVLPVCADYTQQFTLPVPSVPVSNRVVYFPGSTIGNFEPAQAEQFLKHIANLCGPQGGLLIGVDLKKDVRVLEPAYNDRLGVTAAFNLNILHRINEELGADFDVSAFRHHAPYNSEAGRIEMHLISCRAQTVHIGDTAIAFDEGEHIITEYSYKYSLEDFAAMAGRAGFRVAKVWLDERQLFSVQYLISDVA